MSRLKRSGTQYCLCPFRRHKPRSPRRIGIAPSLSLQQPVLSINTVTPANPRPRVAPNAGPPATITGPVHPFAVPGNVKDTRLINTMPNGVGAPAAPDEMGFIARPSSEADERPQAEANGTPPRRRSRTGTVPASNRFTITNMTDNEFSDDTPHTNEPGSAPPIPRTQSPPRQNPWPTAEEEKAKLYQEAKAKVERVQGLDRSESVRVRVLYLVFV